MQTIHLYVVPEPEFSGKKQQISRAVIACIASLLIFLFVCQPQPGNKVYTQKTLIVPALVSKSVTLEAGQPILPTGIRTYPGIKASGILTVYNVSLATQTLPAGVLLTTGNGIAFLTGNSVTLSPSDPPSYSIATVSAYAVLAGIQGNIAPGAIQVDYSSSLEIKNLSAFSGGKDSYSKTYVTSQDRQLAATSVRKQLAGKEPVGLHRCNSSMLTTEKSKISGSLSCQILTYSLPQGVQLLSYALSGNTVILTINVPLI